MMSENKELEQTSVSESEMVSHDASESAASESTASADSNPDQPVQEHAPVAAENVIQDSTSRAEETSETTSQETHTPSEPAIETPAAEEVRPRVQLKPVQDLNQLKAVPSLGDVSEEHISATQVPYAGPVEIPRDADIDTDIEQQLAAAMGGEQIPANLAAPKDESTLGPGDKLKGTVQSVHAEHVIVDLGYRSSGFLNLSQFPEDKRPQVGDSLDLVIEKVDAAEGLIHLNRMSGPRKLSGNWDAVAVGMTVECLVTKTNKGGLDVTVSGLRAFMPASQVDLGFHKELDSFVGQKLECKITDVKPEKRNLIVSRRALLIEQRQENEAVAWSRLEVGQEVAGTVKTLKDYGAFIDLGGVDGLLHVAEITWSRIRHPSDVLQEGQQIQVKILGLDAEKKKITLGMKQLVHNPWDHVETKYAKDAVVEGKVTKLADFGAFVELEDQVEGMIHISELDHKRVGRVGDVLQEGQEVTVKVLEVNKNKKRISLSLKALIEKPQMAEKPVETEPASPAPAPRRSPANLKGGTSSGSGRGLFGNPGDFR